MVVYTGKLTFLILHLSCIWKFIFTKIKALCSQLCAPGFSMLLATLGSKLQALSFNLSFLFTKFIS